MESGRDAKDSATRSRGSFFSSRLGRKHPDWDDFLLSFGTFCKSRRSSAYVTTRVRTSRPLNNKDVGNTSYSCCCCCCCCWFMSAAARKQTLFSDVLWKVKECKGVLCACLFTLVLRRAWTRLKPDFTVFDGIKRPSYLFPLWFKWTAAERCGWTTLPDWTLTKLL